MSIRFHLTPYHTKERLGLLGGWLSFQPSFVAAPPGGRKFWVISSRKKCHQTDTKQWWCMYFSSWLLQYATCYIIVVGGGTPFTRHAHLVSSSSSSGCMHCIPIQLKLSLPHFPPFLPLTLNIWEASKEISQGLSKLSVSPPRGRSFLSTFITLPEDFITNCKVSRSHSFNEIPYHQTRSYAF